MVQQPVGFLRRQNPNALGILGPELSYILQCVLGQVAALDGLIEDGADGI